MKLHEIPCPECKQDYCGLSTDSSSELETSVISCSECGFRFQDSCCEEDLEKKFIETYKPIARYRRGEHNGWPVTIRDDGEPIEDFISELNDLHNEVEKWKQTAEDAAVAPTKVKACEIVERALDT